MKDSMVNYLKEQIEDNLRKLIGLNLYSNTISHKEFEFHFSRMYEHISICFVDLRLPRVLEYDIIKPRFRIKEGGIEYIHRYDIDTPILSNIEHIKYENKPVNVELKLYEIEVKNPARTYASKIIGERYTNVLSRVVTEWTHADPYTSKKVIPPSIDQLHELMDNLMNKVKILHETNTKIINNGRRL